jgi:RND family efflux transporter MFP subunit
MIRTLISTTTAALLLLAITGCTSNTDAKATPEIIKPIRAVTIGTNSALDTRAFPGKVSASEEVALAFRVAGQLDHFNVKEGDFIKKGTVIAELDNSDFLASAHNIESRLAGAKAVLREAALDLNRKKKLLNSDTIAQASFDSSQSSYDSALSSVNSLEQELKKATLQLRYTRLTAPFSGTIAKKNVDNYQYVQAKEPIVQLEKLSALDISVDIPENLWASGLNGETESEQATATFSAYPERSFKLYFKESETRANNDTQTYAVTFTMKKPADISINPGMTADVQLSFKRKNENTFLLPVNAVFADANGTPSIWLISKNGSVHKKRVQTGPLQNDMILIKDGIAAGDKIATSGVHYLTEGQQVSILEGKIGGRK